MMAVRARGLMMCAALLAGCAEGQNADQRGFFGGIGAAASGADIRNVQRLEGAAQQGEMEARLAQRRQEDAVRTASASGRQVTAAEQRLAVLQRDLARQRATIATLRREVQAGTPRADALGRLERELGNLEQERRRATPQDLPGLEQRSRALNEDVRRFGAI